ncbi:MAG: PfkB family carbohydrate kinase [Eubacteriales bacterium]|nr:PfkB family carbohydrate kinase [Eubacteriales bacterium]
MRVSPNLDLQTLEAALNDLSRARVAMIGDLCLDLYIFGDMRLSELSRETPHFPIPVVSERYNPGGAGNVANNIAALKPASFTAIGLVGDDWRGDLLLRALRDNGVDDANVIRSNEVTTNTYVKVIRRGISDVAYEDPRIDFENRKPLSDALADRLISALDRAEFDVLVVSDQMKYGCITPRIREHISRIAESGKIVLVDSRDHAADYRKVIVKPNEVEAARAFGDLDDADAPQLDPNDAQSIHDFAQRIIGKIAARNGERAVITLGSQGCMVYDGEEIHCPAHPTKPPVDIVGAGDTFISAMGTALAAGHDLETAARIACLASAVTVRKIGTTGTATREEILAVAAE